METDSTLVPRKMHPSLGPVTLVWELKSGATRLVPRGVRRRGYNGLHAGFGVHPRVSLIERGAAWFL